MTDDSDTGDFKVILTSAIPQVTQVRLYSDTIDHISDRHPEVIEKTGTFAIEDTIENPTEVYSSATDIAGSFIYVSSLNTLEGHPLTVPVKIVEGTSARARTAYHNRQSQPQGRLVWRGGGNES